MTTTWIVLIALVALAAFAITQYNALVRLNVGVDEAFAQIEVQLQRRSDLIPNLVETVKGYASHEKETFERVVQARAAATAASSTHDVADVAAADGMLTQALRGLLAVSEAYPDLKASANFMSLQEELAGTENKVSFARQYYNDNVRKLNATIVAIPGKFFAGMAKVTARVFYEVADPEARKAPKVQF
jgi:LemA protein